MISVIQYMVVGSMAGLIAAVLLEFFIRITGTISTGTLETFRKVYVFALATSVMAILVYVHITPAIREAVYDDIGVYLVVFAAGLLTLLIESSGDRNKE